MYLFRDEYIFQLPRAIVAEVPQLGHATYIFARAGDVREFVNQLLPKPPETTFARTETTWPNNSVSSDGSCTAVIPEPGIGNCAVESAKQWTTLFFRFRDHAVGRMPRPFTGRHASSTSAKPADRQLSGSRRYATSMRSPGTGRPHLVPLPKYFIW